MNLTRIVALKRICFSLFLAASMFGDVRGQVSEKIRESKLTKLIAETTIFELTPQGKVPVNSFQSVLEKEWPKKLSTHDDKNLGMKIVYIWTKTNSSHYSFGEKSVREMDTFTLNMHTVNPVYFADKKMLDAKNYIMKMQQAIYFLSYHTYDSSPELVQTFTLNFSGFQHIVSEPVRVFNFNAGKIYGVYEIHIKLKQVFR